MARPKGPPIKHTSFNCPTDLYKWLVRKTHHRGIIEDRQVTQTEVIVEALEALRQKEGQ